MISSTIMSFLPESVFNVSLPMILLGVLCTAVVSYFVYSRFFKSTPPAQKETFVQEISQQESESESPPDSQPAEPIVPQQEDYSNTQQEESNMA